MGLLSMIKEAWELSKFQPDDGNYDYSSGFSKTETVHSSAPERVDYFYIDRGNPTWRPTPYNTSDQGGIMNSTMANIHNGVEGRRVRAVQGGRTIDVYQ